jgi:dolichol-phosphate mannosyltransferase
MNRVDLSVVIPALNERENLERLIPAIQQVTGELGIASEIIVVDGPSRDGTSEAAARLGARVVKQTERGYGGALLAGFEIAAAPHILTMDADLSHPAAFIRDLWTRRDEADLLIASRYVPGGGATVGAFRRILSLVLNVVYRIVLQLPVRDLSSGFRLYRRDELRRLKLESRDFDVQEEILVRGHNRGWRIREVAFHYMPREAGSSHVRLLQFGWAYLKTLVKMWRLRFLG